MTDARKPSNSPPERETVLAKINDPAPLSGLTDAPPKQHDPHENTDDPTVLARINGPGPEQAEDEPEPIEPEST